MSEKSSAKKYTLLLRLTFLAISLAILIRIVDVKMVLHHVRDIPLFIVGILVAISIFRTWLTGLRWQMLNPDVSGQLGRWEYFRLMMISNASNLVMPGALGGDVVRTAMTLKAVKNKRVDNFIAIVADRFIGIFSIIAIGSVALVFTSDIPDKQPFYRLFGMLLSVFFLSVIAAGNPFLLRLLESIFSRMGRIGRQLVHVLELWKNALSFFRRNYTRVLLALAICLPIHGAAYVSSFVLIVILDIPLSFVDACMVMSLVWVITAIPITISGAGIRELSLVYFLSLYGVEPEYAVALSVYKYVVALVLGFIGLFFLFIIKKT